MKNIGIIGSGAVAQSLAKGFLDLGHSVMLGTRDTAKLADWQIAAGPAATTGSFEEAARFGELIVLAVSGSAAEAALHLSGIANLRGKTIIDTTNPIAPAPPVDGVLQFFTGPNESLMEKLQMLAPGAHFVKAFNSVGNGLMVNPSFKDGKPTMFICGNNEEAKREVTELLTTFNWEVADMGTAVAARAIEPLCILWCIQGLRGGSWSLAFKLLQG